MSTVSLFTMPGIVGDGEGHGGESDRESDGRTEPTGAAPRPGPLVRDDRALLVGGGRGVEDHKFRAEGFDDGIGPAFANEGVIHGEVGSRIGDRLVVGIGIEGGVVAVEVDCAGLEAACVPVGRSSHDEIPAVMVDVVTEVVGDEGLPGSGPRIWSTWVQTPPFRWKTVAAPRSAAAGDAVEICPDHQHLILQGNAAAEVLVSGELSVRCAVPTAARPGVVIDLIVPGVADDQILVIHRDVISEEVAFSGVLIAEDGGVRNVREELLVEGKLARGGIPLVEVDRAVDAAPRQGDGEGVPMDGHLVAKIEGASQAYGRVDFLNFRPRSATQLEDEGRLQPDVSDEKAVSVRASAHPKRLGVALEGTRV